MKHRLHYALALSISSLAFNAASADEFVLDSTVATADIYPNGLVIGRTTSVEVPVGQHEITLDQLPMGWDLESLSLNLSGPEGLVVIGTSTHQGAENQTAVEAQATLYAQAAELQDQIASQQQGVDTLALEKEMVDRFVKDPELFAGRDDALEFWQYVLERNSAIQPELLAAQARVDALLETRTEVLAEARALDQQLVTRQVRARVEAANAGQVDINASYFSHEGRWQPSYKLELTSAQDAPEADLVMVQEAKVWQWTGEDWSDVQTRLHAVVTNNYLSSPVLSSLSLGPASAKGGGVLSSINVYGSSNSATLSSADQDMSSAGFNTFGDVAIGRMQTPEVASVRVAQNVQGFSAIYNLPETLDAASSNSVHQTVVLKRAEFEADLWVQTAGVVDASGTLMAGFSSPLTTVALPGLARIYRDGSFIGRTQLGAIQPGEEVELSFGADPLVSIERHVLDDQEGDRGFIGRRETQSRTIVTTATNAHTFAMPFRLIEAAPVPKHEDISVEFTRATDDFDVEDLEGAEGVGRWDFTLDPGASTTRTLGYEASWPADLNAVFF